VESGKGKGKRGKGKGERGKGKGGGEERRGEERGLGWDVLGVK